MTDPGASALTTHELLLALAGRVDDDLLAASRELVAIGEDGQALELLTATLIADRAALPPQVRDAVVTAGRTLRIGLDAEQALPRPAREDGTAHRFRADAEWPGGSARISDVLNGPAARQLSDCRTWLTWRITPAGSAPGPVPHPVVLVEIGGDDTDTGPEAHATADVLAYQLAATLDRAGARASVEAFVAGSALPGYHAEALSSARPVPVQAGEANARRPAEPARVAKAAQPGLGLGAARPAPAGALAALLGYPDDGTRARRPDRFAADRAGAGRLRSDHRGADLFHGDQAHLDPHDVERPGPEQPEAGRLGAEGPDRAGTERRGRNGRDVTGLGAAARPAEVEPAPPTEVASECPVDVVPERPVERSGATPRPAPQHTRPVGVPPLGIVPPLDTLPRRPAVPLRPARPTPSPSPIARATPIDAATAAEAPAEQTDEDPSAVSETARFRARPPAPAPADGPSPSQNPTADPAQTSAADRDGALSALDAPRPTPSPRPVTETPDDTNGADPPLLAEMNDPLSGPLRQPLLDPLLDPTFGTTSVPSVSFVPSAPSVLTPLPPPSLEADRAVADERGRSWADEWASGDWAMPPSRLEKGRDAVDEEPADRPAPRPAPVVEPAPETGRRRARHRSDPDAEQGLGASAVVPAEDAGTDQAEPAAEPASDVDDPGQDAMSTLSSTERELLRQLHAELAARERPPRSRRAAVTNGSNGSANGVTPPRRRGPPDLAG